MQATATACGQDLPPAGAACVPSAAGAARWRVEGVGVGAPRSLVIWDLGLNLLSVVLVESFEALMQQKASN